MSDATSSQLGGGILRAQGGGGKERHRRTSFSIAKPSEIEFAPHNAPSGASFPPNGVAPSSFPGGTAPSSTQSTRVTRLSSGDRYSTGSLQASTNPRQASSDGGGGGGGGGGGSAASSTVASAKAGASRCFSRLRCRSDSGSRPPRAGSGAASNASGGSTVRGGCWEAALSFGTRVLESYWWSVVLLLFTLVLFFGTSIEDLWCPASSDLAWDVIFTITLAVLSSDLILRCFVEPNYFILSCGGRESRLGRDGSRRNDDGHSGCCPDKWLRIGSFMFWCDLLSTMTLLFDISYINKRRQTMETMFITIDWMGFPTSGITDINARGAVETQTGALEVIIAVCKTARIAHFIRTMAVINSSSRLPLYRVLRYVDPLYWVERSCRKNSRHQSGGLLSDMTDAAPQDGTEPSSSHHSGTVPPNRRRMSRSKRASFSSSMLDPPVSSVGGGGLFRRALVALGCSFRAEEKARRNMAAIKIQRSWRRSRGKARPRSISSKGRSSRQRVKSVAKSLMLRPRGGSVSGSTKREAGSQVGFAMRELTGQRVALGIMIALVFTVLFTYDEEDVTSLTTMVILHNQSQNVKFGVRAINAARSTSIPTLYEYTFVNGSTADYLVGIDPDLLREREKLLITIFQEGFNTTTSGLLTIRQNVHDYALVELVSTIFILLVWFSGVTAFAGPVMTLVVIPIERMIRLLNMLMEDPLGYQGSGKYKKFVAEEDEFIKNTRWSKEVLRGMETSFLMSTILRIGSLMKVGFGSAGVEIIQGNLQKGKRKEITFLNTQGSTVQCIFLFCDIRQFTDATECLQEEVFVFTNKIAAVVHAWCAAYDGSANKNVGDAFLMSWLLDDPSKKRLQRDTDRFGAGSFGGGFGGGNLAGNFGSDDLVAKHNEADKSLLSVVKICIALYHEKFFLESMSDGAKGKLTDKLAKRKGTIVQMGFGLHAGKAVQGALGSQRKLDATYVGEVVDRAEFLESSTKQYGLKMLMSGDFHKLLHPSNRRRCRKINQVVFVEQDDANEDENMCLEEMGDIMELYTFDLDIDSLWRHNPKPNGEGSLDEPSLHNPETASESEGSLRPSVVGADETASHSVNSKRDLLMFGKSKKNLTETDSVRSSRRRRVSLLARGRPGSNHAREGLSDSWSDRKVSITGPTIDAISGSAVGTSGPELNDRGVPKSLPNLELPTGRQHYNASVWVNEEMRKIRHRFSDGIFFNKFNSGLQSYFSRDWEHARQCFLTILERVDDGPSRYFLKQIEANNGIPPRDFSGFERA